MLCRNQSTPRSLIYPLKLLDYHHPNHYRWRGHSLMSPMFCSSPKQHESSWRKLAVRKEASHIHSAVVLSANSAAKQKNKQQLERLRRLKVLARAPLARLRRDLGCICQSSSTRKSQSCTSVFDKSILLISSAFICTPTPNVHFRNLMTGTASHCCHFSQALSGLSSTTPPATLQPNLHSTGAELEERDAGSGSVFVRLKHKRCCVPERCKEYLRGLSDFIQLILFDRSNSNVHVHTCSYFAIMPVVGMHQS
ncbi:hypothetical protein QQF64_008289 [Cirrhinus molitorella]|uniref:Uncharacterized protein n=1 Tax=Cirrhinus molitorella TaxID=172907 RepID=A0ABR3M5R7_9TELE